MTQYDTGKLIFTNSYCSRIAPYGSKKPIITQTDHPEKDLKSLDLRVVTVQVRPRVLL